MKKEKKKGGMEGFKRGQDDFVRQGKEWWEM